MNNEIEERLSNIMVSLENGEGVSIHICEKKDVNYLISNINKNFENDYKIMEIDLDKINSLDKLIETIIENSKYPLFSQDFESLGYDLYEVYDGDLIIIIQNFTLENARKMSFNFSSQIRGWYDRGYANFVIFSNEDLYDIETNLTIAGSLLSTTFKVFSLEEMYF